MQLNAKACVSVLYWSVYFWMDFCLSQCKSVYSILYVYWCSVYLRLRVREARLCVCVCACAAPPVTLQPPAAPLNHVAQQERLSILLSILSSPSSYSVSPPPHVFFCSSSSSAVPPSYVSPSHRPCAAFRLPACHKAINTITSDGNLARKRKSFHKSLRWSDQKKNIRFIHKTFLSWGIWLGLMEIKSGWGILRAQELHSRLY